MKIRKRVYHSGREGWQVDFGIVDGKRVQKAYTTLDAAKKAASTARKSQKTHGESAGALTVGEMREVLVVRERLAEAAATLTEAVDYYLKHAGGIRERITVMELFDRFIDSRIDLNLRERYIRQLRVSLKSLGRALPFTEVPNVTEADILAWLNGSQWAPKTRNNYLGDARTMWSWAITKKYASQSPCKDIPIAATEDHEIKVLAVDECKVLLSAALGDTELMGYIVLATFGGVRPAEINRMSWNAVEMTEGWGEIAGKFAKTRRRRAVDLTENARAWLCTCPPGEGKICKAGFVERWTVFRRRLGWGAGDDAAVIRSAGRRSAVKLPVTRGEWPQNALRHTYASNHYASHQNEALLQAQMGHDDKDQLFRAYRRLVTRASAEKFWSLRPDENALLWSPFAPK